MSRCARMVDYLTGHHLAREPCRTPSGGPESSPATSEWSPPTSSAWAASTPRSFNPPSGGSSTTSGSTTRTPGPAAPSSGRIRHPVNYGCWDSVSCYHGVAGAFRAFAAIPVEHRTPEITERLEQALEYLRIHRLYKRSTLDKPLFRHLTQFFLVGDYRSDLLDMLQGLADADPSLIGEEWVAAAYDDMVRPGTRWASHPRQELRQAAHRPDPVRTDRGALPVPHLPVADDPAHIRRRSGTGELSGPPLNPQTRAPTGR